MKIHNSLLVLIGLLMGSINVSSQVFRYVVATDGTGDYNSIQSALNACPDGQASMIFIKNGTYNEQVTLGSKTASSTKKISLIGESYGGVIITHNQYRASSGSPTYEDICTVKFYASDLYCENLTIQNTATAGMAEALYTAGDRQIFRNCKIQGYQDTYRSKKGTRGYFKNCWFEGAVDFIYAGGTLFIDDCTINCVNGGGHIVAPEDSYTTKTSPVTGKTLKLGFVFRRCTITANPNVASGSFDLGRPWNINAGAYYLNCKLGNHIKSAGWATMSGNETTASFGEYNSMNPDGTLANVSGRISWSFQLQQYDVDSILNPGTVYSTTYTTPFDPITSITPTDKPDYLILNGNVLSWPAVAGASGYIIYKGANYIGSTTDVTFTDQSGTSGVYSVKAMNAIGVLSDATSVPTGISVVKENPVHFQLKSNRISFDKIQTKIELFSSNGIKLCQATNSSTLLISTIKKGAYILLVQTSDGNIVKKKLEI